MQVLELLTHYVSFGTFVGAVVAASALVLKLKQDAKDLRRKQAEVSRLLYNDLHQDEYSMAALLMLDYPCWRHSTKDFSKIEISFQDVEIALTVMHQVDRPEKELLVRRSFDALFSKLENVIELAHREIGLVRWSDFAALFGFYISLMRQPKLAKLLTAYATEYGSSRIVDVIARSVLYPLARFDAGMKVSAPSANEGAGSGA